jgi:hypothetical protein
VIGIGVIDGIVGVGRDIAFFSPSLDTDELLFTFSVVAYIPDVYVVLSLNAFYGYGDRLYSSIGMRYMYSGDYGSAMLHYIKSNEETSVNGGLLQAEVGTNLYGVDLYAGFMQTDEEGGIGSIDSLGDSTVPTVDGNYVYAVNSKTPYLKAEYMLNDLFLSTVYTKSTYINNQKENELNIMAEYQINDKLSSLFTFVNVDNSNATNDYSKYQVSVTYSY